MRKLKRNADIVVNNLGWRNNKEKIGSWKTKYESILRRSVSKRV